MRRVFWSVLMGFGCQAPAQEAARVEPPQPVARATLAPSAPRPPKAPPAPQPQDPTPPKPPPRHNVTPTPPPTPSLARRASSCEAGMRRAFRLIKRPEGAACRIMDGRLKRGESQPSTHPTIASDMCNIEVVIDGGSFSCEGERLGQRLSPRCAALFEAQGDSRVVEANSGYWGHITLAPMRYVRTKARGLEIRYAYDEGDCRSNARKGKGTLRPASAWERAHIRQGRWKRRSERTWVYRHGELVMELHDAQGLGAGASGIVSGWGYSVGYDDGYERRYARPARQVIFGALEACTGAKPFPK